MRGTRAIGSERDPTGRFIPARAGNASIAAAVWGRGAVHPRACGERGILSAPARIDSGSSPRVRGTLRRLDGVVVAHRFIPARAGNARLRARAAAMISVHPRACGERSPSSTPASDRLGSSPRVRGTLGGARSADRDMRFIPARAGNAPSDSTRPRRPAVHPRACGERSVRTGGCHLQPGSSPRVRGTQAPAVIPNPAKRFIPARAGNAPHTTPRPSPAPVHPRACGERFCSRQAWSISFGSSPRVRGTQVLACDRPIRPRFIPARAGNATVGPAPTLRLSVHPRACGERAPLVKSLSRCSGSSPRVRGTRSRTGASARDDRFIPARAGNACLGMPRQAAPTVHPRACGERGMNWQHCARIAGSSPRVRGTLWEETAEFAVLRFIPARAGNASAARIRPPSTAVHPRACGERVFAAAMRVA